MRKKILVSFFCIFGFTTLYAQSTTSIEDIFKMQLFLNKKNSIFREMDYSVSKNDSLYSVFKETVKIKMDTLKVSNHLKGQLNEEYCFYKVSENNIEYIRKFNKDEHRYLLIDIMQNCYFILGVNKQTGTSYRLAGFDNNDFLSFLNDFKENYLFSNMKKIKTKTFLKGYEVSNLDFLCLYSGLRRNEFSRSDFPCLQRCSEPIKIQ